MKNITLTLTVFIVFFISSSAQHRENSSAIRSNEAHAATNSSTDHMYNEGNDDILIISATDSNSASDIFTARSASNTNESLFMISSRGELDYNAVPVTVNLSSGISPSLTTNVSYTTLQRVWRIEELNENTPAVTVKIPSGTTRMDSNEGNYYMFVSDSGTFNASTEHQLMTLDDRGNLETEYDFSGVTYITFGYAPKVTAERSIYFNGETDYIDIQNKLNLKPSGFTISAWIKSNAGNTNKVSILSKRDSEFTEGYDLTLTNDNRIEIQWKNTSLQSLTSDASIPNEQWHHVAVTYNGSLVSLYIDGVLDNAANRTAPLDNKNSFLLAAAAQDSPIQHFKGQIDEVRIWDTSLTEAQLRFIMNQEITDNSGLTIGKESQALMTKNEINTVPWSDLAAYYPMSEFTFKNIVDMSGHGNDGKIINLNTVDIETAPLPFVSQQNGDWDSSSSWENGRFQYRPGSTSIVDPNITIDWNIVKTAHNLTIDNSNLPAINKSNRTLLALFVESNELVLIGDTATHKGNGLEITHYLELAGKIDLEGESQLIQTLDSDLNVLTDGFIERDQQGTADTYTYNYWSSPVTKENATYDSFKITDVMKDGTLSANPQTINFSSSGYDGAPTAPIKIADYWIWKYANQSSQNFSSWQHIRRTGTILPGEGFTMKGPGTGSIENEQNYVFSGKPNNGNITLTLAANNDYLVGNPYPSAIDANQFIRDNGPQTLNDGITNASTDPLISGTLYFWKHWGGNSHMAQAYEGGYAIYNLSGSVAAASKISNIPGSSAEELSAEKPGRFIPVGQGFFVVGEAGGTINFNNNQRVFNQEESGNSLFMRAATTSNTNNTENGDDRMKFRIGFNSINTIYRQLLLTIDEHATTGEDWAYDGKLNENQIDDMFWMINDAKYVIQGSNEAEITSTYPIGVKTNTNGINTISIDGLENIPSDINIYVHDLESNLYHDLKASDFEIFLNAGEYLNRFEITFGTDEDALSTNEDIEENIALLYSNDFDKIILINPTQIDVKSIAMYNLLGQSVYSVKDIIKSDRSEFEVNNLSSGAYIIKLLTAQNTVMTKKIIVN